MNASKELLVGFPVLPSVFTEDEKTRIKNITLRGRREQGRGLVERMDFGRTLAELQKMVAKQRGLFGEFCEYLEIDDDIARYRIQLSASWDAIKKDLGDDPIPMPTIESHLEALFKIPALADRATAWRRLRSQVETEGRRLTARLVELYVDKFLALPAQTEPVHGPNGATAEKTLDETDDNLEMASPAEELDELGISQQSTPAAEAPLGLDATKPAVVTAETTTYTRSPEALKAIDRIGRICGPGWKKVLLDEPRKLLDQDLMNWAAHPDDQDVMRISRILESSTGTGVARAIRYLHNPISEKTTLGELENRCIAEGGKWEYEKPGFRFVVEHVPI
jgi:hypothetical protein